jgi:hypothetical protein
MIRAAKGNGFFDSSDVLNRQVKLDAARSVVAYLKGI